jgi:hypothetical protein
MGSHFDGYDRVCGVYCSFLFGILLGILYHNRYNE